MTADESTGLAQLTSSTEPLRHSVSPAVSDFTGISSNSGFLASLSRLHAEGIVDGLIQNDQGPSGVPHAWRLTRLGELHIQTQAITPAAPAITSLTPSTASIATAAGKPVSVTVTGTGFRGHQVVKVNGVVVPFRYVNKTTFTVSYLLPAASTVQFSVVDGATGQASGNSPFVVAA